MAEDRLLQDRLHITFIKCATSGDPAKPFAASSTFACKDCRLYVSLHTSSSPNTILAQSSSL